VVLDEADRLPELDFGHVLDKTPKVPLCNGGHTYMSRAFSALLSRTPPISGIPDVLFESIPRSKLRNIALAWPSAAQRDKQKQWGREWTNRPSKRQGYRR
jgi:hypothetical protein